MTNLQDPTSTSDDSASNLKPTDRQHQPTADRRTMIRRLALGGVGAAAGAVAFSQNASAGDSESPTDIGGNALELGDDVTNTSASPTTVNYSGTDPLTEASALSVGTDGPNATDGNNVFPGAVGGYGKGVVPSGVHGSTVSPVGAGVVAAHLAPAQDADADPQDAAAAALIVASVGGPQIKFVGLPGAVAGPTTGVHSPGELYTDADGTLWFTVPVPADPATDPPADDATPADASAALVVGDVRFLKVAGTPTAGQFHVLPAPQRIFDSRETDDAAKLAAGESLDLDLTKNADGADSGFPTGATAALVNITLDDTENTGFARIVATGTVGVDTSNINWYATGQILANQATTAVSPTGGVTVELSGAGGQTHLIIDLQGYYL